MPLDQKKINFVAGQRLMLGFDGVTFNEDLKYLIGTINAGGIILFKRNIETPDQVKTLCRECQRYAKACGLPPLIISVDQEGGQVARLQEPFTLFKGNPHIKTIQDARQFASVTAEELGQVGVNMNLAPVLDMVPDGVDSIMKKRAFRGDAGTVSKLGLEVISGLQQKGIMAVAKHFPGIGRTVLDSHFELPVLDCNVQTLEQSDLIPFKAAIHQGVAGMMLSHISYPRLDDQWQASLSPLIAKKLLREQLGYTGLVMTDDLDMKAISHDMKTCITQIQKADIDMALICHKGPDIDTAFSEFTKQLSRDRKLYGQGQKALERILSFKNNYLSV